MKQKLINKPAALITIGIHVLLLLLCLFICYTLPAQPAPQQELGMEVNLGNSDDGSGDDQPFSTEKPAQQPEEMHMQKNDATTVASHDLTTDNTDNDAESIRSNKSTNKHPNQTEDNKDKQIKQPKPKLLYAGNTGNGGNAASQNHAGTSEGNGQGKGDKGVPGGTAGAGNYTGVPGNGTSGISTSFVDRNIVAYPEREAVFKEGGRVVIKVTVNRAGVVTNKRIVSSANAELGRIALQKIDKIKFNKNDQAPPEQFGNITFVFKTRAHQ
jgi:TonB family protein